MSHEPTWPSSAGSRPRKRVQIAHNRVRPSWATHQPTSIQEADELPGGEKTIGAYLRNRRANLSSAKSSPMGFLTTVTGAPSEPFLICSPCAARSSMRLCSCSERLQAQGSILINSRHQKLSDEFRAVLVRHPTRSRQSRSWASWQELGQRSVLQRVPLVAPFRSELVLRIPRLLCTSPRIMCRLGRVSTRTASP